MTATVAIEELIQRLDPGARVELFELDLSPITKTDTPDDHVYFHAGTNQLGGPVVWQGKTYNPFAARAEGFEKTVQGSSPRPKLSVANVQSSITTLVDTYDDLVGAKLIRRVTYARYLDEVNFPDRVNLLSFSEEFNQWAPTGSRVITNVTFGPRGKASADKLVESNANEAHYLQPKVGVSVTSGALVTASLSALPMERSKVRVQLNGSAFSSSQAAIVDLHTGQVQHQINLDHPELGDKIQVERESNGWWRIHVTSAAQATGVAFLRCFVIQTATGTIYAGNGTSGIAISDAQLNLGGKKAYEYQGSTFQRNPEADPDQHFPDDVYYIERKVGENPAVVQFELASPMDLEHSYLPARQITAFTCTAEYRKNECPWTSLTGPFFDSFDRPVLTLAEDYCSKTSTGCKLRFGTTAIPLNAFPGTRAYRS